MQDESFFELLFFPLPLSDVMTLTEMGMPAVPELAKVSATDMSAWREAERDSDFKL